MAFALPDLPFPKNALEPHISAETIDYHYGKHHAAYVANLNKMTEGTDWANMSLQQVIAKSEGGVFNNAAQVWNHTFYWSCLSPNGGGTPKGRLANAIDNKWGSLAAFRAEFTKAALGRFGSGWAWLVSDEEGSLSIKTTANAGCPVKEGWNALLTCDVWEHAYYVDYRNARPKYVEAFWNLVDWDYVSEQYDAATS